MDFLDSLNPRQKEAVLHADGPLLILAGAGSGKTRVIISRIAHLIREKSVSPEGILAVTFTNKAADEMRQRVQSLLAEGRGAVLFARSPLVSTFHSFCVRLLRTHGEPLAEVRPGFTKRFSIYDANDQVAAIKSVYRAIGLDEQFMKARAALARISRAKNQGRGPQDFYREATEQDSTRLAVVFERYQALLQSSNALDFDDLLLEAVRLLRSSEAVRETVRDRFEYVMVDEYQDTNRPQYDLMQLVAGEHLNLCVVGDEDQSIYSWRGADIRNILDFEKDYPGARVIRLEQNYRSTKRILAAASAVVANNLDRKGKNLWTDSEDGSPVYHYRARDGGEEASFVARYVDRYLRDHAGKTAAVLYRTNAQSRQIEEALRRLGRDYLVVGGMSFYQRAEVKDLLAYLKAGLSPADSISLLRIINTPARGIGKTTVEQIETTARRNKSSLWDALERMLDEREFASRAQHAVAGFRKLILELRERTAETAVHDLIRWLAEASGYEAMLQRDGSIEAEGRIENINEFISAAMDSAKRDESLEEFLDHAALVSDTDALDDSAAVLLMTLHSAKGLEFPLVAMTGLEESIFPHARSLQDDAGMEEERRLCYVGMTRARECLLLTCARERRRFGGGSLEYMTPSRFLKEVPPDVICSLSAGSAIFASPGETEGMDLVAEQHEVRAAVEKRAYDGPSYDSVDNLASFFSKRGLPVPDNLRKTGAGSQARTGQAKTAQAKGAASPAARTRGATPQPPRPRLGQSSRNLPHSSGFRIGGRVRHPEYGVGTVHRLQGEGEDSKLTVRFESHGLKKLVAKFARLQRI